jgi:hypothetical protein
MQNVRFRTVAGLVLGAGVMPCHDAVEGERMGIRSTLIIAVFAVAAADLRAADPQPFTSTQICKAAIGVVMGRNPATMRIDKSIGDVVYLSYVRPDDQKRWAYKCRLDGNKVLWGADDGRWRDHRDDSIITVNSSATSLTIIERYSDGSSNKTSFTHNQLGK